MPARQAVSRFQFILALSDNRKPCASSDSALQRIDQDRPFQSPSGDLSGYGAAGTVISLTGWGVRLPGVGGSDWVRGRYAIVVRGHLHPTQDHQSLYVAVSPVTTELAGGRGGDDSPGVGPSEKNRTIIGNSELAQLGIMRAEPIKSKPRNPGMKHLEFKR